MSDTGYRCTNCRRASSVIYSHERVVVALTTPEGDFNEHFTGGMWHRECASELAGDE